MPYTPAIFVRSRKSDEGIKTPSRRDFSTKPSETEVRIPEDLGSSILFSHARVLAIGFVGEETPNRAHAWGHIVLDELVSCNVVLDSCELEIGFEIRKRQLDLHDELR